MSNFWTDQEIFQLLIHCFQMLIFVVIAVIAFSVGKLVTSVFLLADTLINMTKTKLSTIYRFILSWCYFWCLGFLLRRRLRMNNSPALAEMA